MPKDPVDKLHQLVRLRLGFFCKWGNRYLRHPVGKDGDNRHYLGKEEVGNGVAAKVGVSFTTTEILVPLKPLQGFIPPLVVLTLSDLLSLSK